LTRGQTGDGRRITCFSRFLEGTIMLALDELVALSCMSWAILALTLVFDWWNQNRSPAQ
jgi:hypothetical protein